MTIGAYTGTPAERFTVDTALAERTRLVERAPSGLYWCLVCRSRRDNFHE